MDERRKREEVEGVKGKEGDTVLPCVCGCVWLLHEQDRAPSYMQGESGKGGIQSHVSPRLHDL